MAELFTSGRAQRIARAVVKPTTSRLGLHVRRYTRAVQGLDPWRDATVLLAADRRPTILDIGANQGQSATRFARIWPDAVIHCFEPSPQTFAILQRNVARLGVTVKPVNAGVGAETTRSVLLENSHSDMSSFLTPADESWGHTTSQTTVDIVTVDAYCEREGITAIDLLKSDTQGYDLEVLKGASGMLERGAVRLVFLELIFAELYEDVPSFDVVYRFLTERGFHFVGLYEPHHTADGRMAWCDVLFAHGSTR